VLQIPKGQLHSAADNYSQPHSKIWHPRPPAHCQGYPLQLPLYGEIPHVTRRPVPDDHDCSEFLHIAWTCTSRPTQHLLSTYVGTRVMISRNVQGNRVRGDRKALGVSESRWLTTHFFGGWGSSLILPGRSLEQGENGKLDTSGTFSSHQRDHISIFQGDNIFILMIIYNKQKLLKCRLDGTSVIGWHIALICSCQQYPTVPPLLLTSLCGIVVAACCAFRRFIFPLPADPSSGR